MPTWDPRVNDLFLKALELHSPSERQVYLDVACDADAARRAEVESLLEASACAGSFLESPAPTLSFAVDLQPVSEGTRTVIGPYKLLEQIGEGGFGVVFMAEQTHPVRRKVALKVLKEGMDTRQVVARFGAERQALALMDHPNIARVLEAGATDQGRPYFVMELVKGVPITQYCDEKRLTPRERLDLFIPVCQAIQHAHQKGIIHRDLKPSNVLVGVYDGKPMPKVIDFGVAKAAGSKLTEATLFTGFGTIIGTPEYMSPEQAQLDNLDIDTRSDIYSLGVLLYELLTGTTPFTKKDLEEAGLLETLRMIREQDPPKPSTILTTAGRLPILAANRGTEPARLMKLVRGELDWIVMKCLEKDRSRRYETANGLAMDIERYLRDEPVTAGPPSAAYRYRKFARRNRALLATASVIALVVSMAVAVSTGLIWRANQNLQEALGREQRDSYLHRIDMVHNALSADNLGRALKLLNECPEDLREWEWHYLMRLCRFDPLVIHDPTEVHGLAFSLDGKQLASAGKDGTIKIRNSKTGDVVETLPAAHSNLIVSVAFHRDGKHLASRGADRVKVWDLTTRREVFSEECWPTRTYGSAHTVAFSPDGRYLTFASHGVVKVWDWKKNQLLHSLPEHDFHSIPVAFSRDGRLATGNWPKSLKLWDPQTGTHLRTLPAHDIPISALAFSADGRWLASASYDRTVGLWDLTTGGLPRNLLHPGNQVECVAISPAGRRLASGCEDKTVRIWDATTGREILVLRGHTDKCGCVAFSPDGHRLASASFDGTIRIWDGTPLREDEPRQEALTFSEHSDEIRGVAISPDGLRIASAGMDGLVRVWDAQTGEVSTEFRKHLEARGHTAVLCLAWHPKGHLIASGSNDALRVWDARTGREAFPLPPGMGRIAMPYNAVAFSPNGRYLVTANGQGALQVYDGETGQRVGGLESPTQDLRALVFSGNGRHLASATLDGIVKLWDAKRLNEKQEARRTPIRARFPGPCVNLAFSPDGRRLATGGEQNTAKIWDVQTWGEPKKLEGHRGEVYTLAFSPDDDGRWIATGGEDSTVKVWDSHTGKLVHTFRGHTGIVSSVAFSPDVKYLVSGSRDFTVKVWDLMPLSKLLER
jgi:WD40 repeat protein/serine/threonine protein kinase